MNAPAGYESTAVWEAFEEWLIEADLPGLPEHVDSGEVFWPAFRDGYSLGLKEQDV